VVALDHDPASVEATIDNARVNGVVLDIRRHDLRSEPTPAAATVAANLLGPLLVEWAAELARPGADAQPQRVIASGLLISEVSRVSDAFVAAGLQVVERRERGEWAALLLARVGDDVAGRPSSGPLEPAR
jgi:ribosomal protein L11 methyltransferase